MALSITQVELYQFRNYRTFALDDIGGVTVFVGENAVGKTNLLEALHLVCACQSFRHATTEQLLMEDAAPEQARVAAVLADENRNLTVEMVIDGGKRKYRVNGKVKPSSEIRGLAPSVVFTPDDLALIKGSHSQKRAALDALGEQLKPNYQQVRLNYEDILRQKNKLLKDGYSADFLAGVNDVLVVCGAQLTLYRSSLFDKLAPKIIERYAELSGGREQLGCMYIPSWILHGQLDDAVFSTEDDGEEVENTPLTSDFSYFPVKLTRDRARDAMRRALDNRTADECIRQRAIIGPHMDKIYFTIDGKDAGDYASQGQQRSIVLAWKLAEVDLIRELLGISPILLLDDVMSELDANRRAALEACITTGSQAFITTTNLGYFTDSALADATVVHLPR